MKKIIFVIMFISMSFILFNACNKNEVMNSKSQNLNEQSFKEAQLEKRIIAFRDKIDLIRENPSLKSGTDPMDVDSAIWYIEATSNFTYGDATSTLEDYVVDSAFIEIPLTNGQILWSDVQVGYDQVIDSLSDHYAAISASDKQLIVADISLKETTDNTVTFEVLSGFGADDIGCGLGLYNNNPWYWGEEMGRCDGSGLGVGCDGADKIAQLANLMIGVPSDNNAYYTDVYIQQDICPWNVPTTQNPYGNYLLFYDYYTYPNYICMSTNELSYYKNALIEVGVLYNPPNKSVIKYYLRDDLIPGGGSTTVFHIANIKYAIWHSSGNPPEEF